MLFSWKVTIKQITLLFYVHQENKKNPVLHFTKKENQSNVFVVFFFFFMVESSNAPFSLSMYISRFVKKKILSQNDAINYWWNLLKFFCWCDVHVVLRHLQIVFWPVEAFLVHKSLCVTVLAFKLVFTPSRVCVHAIVHVLCIYIFLLALCACDPVCESTILCACFV